VKLHTSTIEGGPKRAALIHGFSADGGTWFEFAPWLASLGYEVTAVDLRGHGHSPRADSYTLREVADDLTDTLPAGLDLVTGHSLGGLALSMVAAKLQPAKAVYFDPAWYLPAEQTGQAPQAPVNPDGSPLNVDQIAELMPSRSRAQIEQIARFWALFDLGFIGQLMEEVAQGPDLAPTPNPVVPSLVLAADPSQLVPPDMQRRLADGGYEVRVVPGGQHDLHLDNLEATKAALKDWL
jgi:pimeloyl-ACP methyl ester carboxylesterase